MHIIDGINTKYIGENITLKLNTSYTLQHLIPVIIQNELICGAKGTIDVSINEAN